MLFLELLGRGFADSHSPVSNFSNSSKTKVMKNKNPKIATPIPTRAQPIKNDITEITKNIFILCMSMIINLLYLF